jgi:hypothetical protein
MTPETFYENQASSLNRDISLTPGKLWRVFFEKDLFEKRKILRKDLGKHLA